MIRQVRAQLMEDPNFIQTSHPIALELSSFISLVTIPRMDITSFWIPVSVIKN
jgi:hypothetical protein